MRGVITTLQDLGGRHSRIGHYVLRLLRSVGSAKDMLRILWHPEPILLGGECGGILFEGIRLSGGAQSRSLLGRFCRSGLSSALCLRIVASDIIQRDRLIGS
jgi:hypothetical protein